MSRNTTLTLRALFITVILICVGALVTIEVCDQPPTPRFVVSDGAHNVSYDAQNLNWLEVYFDAGRRVVVQIRNPYPDFQYLEVFNQTTGQRTDVKEFAILNNNNYTITVCNLDGKALAHNKLHIIRDNSV